MSKLAYGIMLMMLLSCEITFPPKQKTFNFPPSGLLNEGITVVEYGADWCPGCRAAKPIIEKFQKEYLFQLISIDTSQDNIEQWKDYIALFYIPLIPTISIFKDGRIYYHGPWPSEQKFRILLDNLVI